jgi:methyl-accepting chemotaxis protein
MFNWFNNLRMGTKLLTTFIGLAVLAGLAQGGIGYLNLNNVNGILKQITEQRIPSVKNATTVERYALRTIMDEKMYLLAANDSRMDAASYQKSAMDNIEQINAALDEVDKVASAYNDQDLLGKSKEVRTVTAQYRDLYNSGVAKVTANQQTARVMGDTGQKVVDLAKAYYQNVIVKTDEQSLKALPIVIDIWDTALETRLNQNKYMLYKDKSYYTALEEGIKKLKALYNELLVVTIDAQEMQKVAEARQATDVYYQAAQDWVKNDDELQSILDQMATIGATV